MGGGGVTVPKPKKFTYTALDPDSLHYISGKDANTQAAAGDQDYYARADAEYAKAHPDLVAANKQEESDVRAEAGGAVPAAVQNQWAQAGISGALTGGADLTQGGQGAAGFAKNLGVDAMSYVNNARDRLAKLTAANPERSFGLSGSAQVGMDVGNNATKNQVMSGNNQGLNSANLTNVKAQNDANIAQAQINEQAAAAQSAMIGSIVQGVGSAVGGMF